MSCSAPQFELVATDDASAAALRAVCSDAWASTVETRLLPREVGTAVLISCRSRAALPEERTGPDLRFLVGENSRRAAESFSLESNRSDARVVIICPAGEAGCPASIMPGAHIVECPCPIPSAFSQQAAAALTGLLGTQINRPVISFDLTDLLDLLPAGGLTRFATACADGPGAVVRAALQAWQQLGHLSGLAVSSLLLAGGMGPEITLDEIDRTLSALQSRTEASRILAAPWCANLEGMAAHVFLYAGMHGDRPD